MAPGSNWVYREVAADGSRQRVEVTVTNRTKTILGITATVVHDRVTEDTEFVEDTHDWYAQDQWGGLWYLGEDTTEYENGKPEGKHGSWEAGFDGAQAGLVISPSPEVGMSYRQEYYAGEAEDRGGSWGGRRRPTAWGSRARCPPCRARPAPTPHAPPRPRRPGRDRVPRRRLSARGPRG